MRAIRLLRSAPVLCLLGTPLLAAQTPPQPPPPSDQPEAQAPLEISSESAELSRSGDARIKGLEMKQGERQLSADEAEYDAASRSFRVKGDVRYEDPQLSIAGSTGSYDVVGGVRIGGARFELRETSGRGFTNEILITPRGRILLDGVRYTTCPEEAPDWVLKASDITLDTRVRNGIGRDVRLDFKGVPILYTPFISFPLGDERKSGFLFPDFGHSSRSGIDLSIPYYFNLAPNYDLTLTSQYMSRRGVGLLPEFRYLTRRQRGALTGHFLPGDDLRNRDRSFVQWEHRADLPRAWRLDIAAANAGDNNYFEDFGLGAEGASITYVERTAELNHYGRHWRVLAQVQNFQTIDEAIPQEFRPYSRLPRLTGRGEWTRAALGLDYSVQGELVYFHRNSHDVQDIIGARADLQPEISWSFTRPGLYITPAVGFRYTSYRLENTTPQIDDTPERSAPLASLDAGMLFERFSRDGERVQTLEPRLLYLYVPFREQDHLPVFDTGVPDLNLVQLFRRNRYVGADRLSDANQLSAGITTRLLDAESGRQFLSATFGQTYYFELPRVSLPGETPLVRKTSNFVSQLSLTAYRNWNVNLGHEWNPQVSGSEKTELALQYRPGAENGGSNRVINAGYRFRRDLIEQVDASVAWPVARRWNVFARGVYSLRDNTLIEQFAGFEYASCCWRLRLVQRRYVSDRTGERDSSIALQLELNGLSTVGIPADAFLERSIRGYSR